MIRRRWIRECPDDVAEQVNESENESALIKFQPPPMGVEYGLEIVAYYPTFKV